jgi:hypothetical protein
MYISIKTDAIDGTLIFYLIDKIDNKRIKILELHNNDNATCMLVPGYPSYEFEWHLWSHHDATYEISAKIDSENPGFPPFNWKKSYRGSHRDMGGFPFSI